MRSSVEPGSWPAEAARWARHSRKGISIFPHCWSMWTRDLDKATAAAEQLEAGYTWINSPQIIFDELPFGGVQQSGLGKEHGSEALDYYMETKSVVVARAQRSS